MPEIKQGLNLGDLLKYEAPNLYSRDRITVAAGQTLALGTVLGEVTASGELTALDPRRRGRQRRRRGRPPAGP